jgi:hypothetical protein
MAVSFDLPFNSCQAPYFAFAIKSNWFDGGFASISPWVDYVNKAYNCSNTSLAGFSVKVLLLITASSNNLPNSIKYFFQKYTTKSVATKVRNMC